MVADISGSVASFARITEKHDGGPRGHLVGVALMEGFKGMSVVGMSINPHHVRLGVQLSLLHKWSDIFWFSFFHEVAHILKHPKKAVFLDDASAGDTTLTKEEQEANQFSANVLISTADRKRMTHIELTFASVKSFSESIGVHPGIVVGALLHAGLLGYGHPLHRLRERYELKAD